MLHYKIKRDWLTGLYNAIRFKVVRRDAVPSDLLWFECVVDLYRNEVLQSPSGISNVAKLPYADISIKNFLSVGRLIAPEARVRKGGAMRIRSFSCLTASFIPPSSVDVLPVFRNIVEAHCEAMSKCAYGERISVILASYFALLTLHPFEDGNGRVSRHFFASQLMQIDLALPEFALLMHAIYIDEAKWHSAAWLARSGDFELLRDLYLKSLFRASSLLNEARESGLDDSDPREIRTALQAVLLKHRQNLM